MVEAVYEAVKTGLSTYRAGKIPTPNLPPIKKIGKEIACAILSDVQLAKVTPTYNTQIAEERVIRYANKIVNLTNIQREATNITKISVFAVGDIIEGELIFPGQEHTIDSSLYSQVTVDAPRILTQFFDLSLIHI